MKTQAPNKARGMGRQWTADELEELARGDTCPLCGVKRGTSGVPLCRLDSYRNAYFCQRDYAVGGWVEPTPDPIHQAVTEDLEVQAAWDVVEAVQRELDMLRDEWETTMAELSTVHIQHGRTLYFSANEPNDSRARKQRAKADALEATAARLRKEMDEVNERRVHANTAHRAAQQRARARAEAALAASSNGNGQHGPVDR